MSRAELKQSLERLRRELAALGPNDSEVRERLSPLIDEIEQEIGTLATSDNQASQLEKLRNHVEAFEVEHPRVTNILNDIMVTLSNLGI
jgi:chaperonin cofactor prefoldin